MGETGPQPLGHTDAGGWQGFAVSHDAHIEKHGDVPSLGSMGARFFQALEDTVRLSPVAVRRAGAFFRGAVGPTRDARLTGQRKRGKKNAGRQRNAPPSSSGLGHQVLILETGVRFP